MNETSVLGLLLGCMTGDSIGLPYEGLSAKRQKKLFKNIDKHNLFFGKGLVSDDTEHAVITAHAIIKSKGDPTIFLKELATGLKIWFLTLPYGIGLATLKSCFKLLIGISPEKSGINSAGNGPAMRSPLIGLCFGDDLKKMKQLNKLSTCISHSDKKAEIASLTIAFATYLSSLGNIVNSNAHSDDTSYISGATFMKKLNVLLKDFNDTEFIDLMTEVIQSVENGETTKDYVIKKGWKNGVSGYIYQTVPAVIHCWLRNQNNYKDGLLEIISCGGDTDTTCAILGSIIGVRVGATNIPKEWLENIIAFPITNEYMHTLAKKLVLSLNGDNVIIRKPLFIFALIRNLLAYPIILFHGFRRLFPPY